MVAWGLVARGKRVVRGLQAPELPPGLTKAKLEKFVREREWYQSHDFLAPFGVKALSDSEAKWRALALPSLEGKTVLDLGCNTGALTFRALDAGAAFGIGVDHDAEAVRTATTIRERIRLEPRAIFVCSQIDRFLDDVPASFDVVIGASVGHYLNLPMLLRRLSGGAAGLVSLELPYVRGSSEFHVSRRGEILIPGEKALAAIAAAFDFELVKKGESEPLDEDERAVFHFVSRTGAAPARYLAAR
jgi:SAM-dependent methyltransferase